MDFFSCVAGRRTCRRFRSDAVDPVDVDRMIDAGRYAPTGYNKQPVRFASVTSPEAVERMFAFTGWLTGKPDDSQRPAAYVVVLNDNDVMGGSTSTDCATYAVMLAAHALGYGSCWHGVGKKDELRLLLGVAENLEPRVVVSLGRPDETFEVADPSDDWKVKKGDDGVVRLGKLGREKAIVAQL